MNSGKTVDLIAMLFGVVGWIDPRNHVLDGVQVPHREWTNLGLEIVIIMIIRQCHMCCKVTERV